VCVAAAGAGQQGIRTMLGCVMRVAHLSLELEEGSLAEVLLDHAAEADATQGIYVA
jgi:hypothetical protein